jgi:hypothetical protein
MGDPKTRELCQQKLEVSFGIADRSSDALENGDGESLA